MTSSVPFGDVAIWWIETYLCHGPGDVVGQPLNLNDDQRQFLRNVYAQSERAAGWRRTYRRAFLSRPKGSAKSELAGAIACFEALGPCRMAGIENGKMVPRRQIEPFVRCLATETEQAGNTYDNVFVMMTEGKVASKYPGLDVGLSRTLLPGGGEIRPSTSGAASKDGGKETFAVFDETHLYTLPAHTSMFKTVRRNLYKRKIADPWGLETSTMYALGQDSIAEKTHRLAKAIEDGKVNDPSLLFDHRQGPDEFDWDDDEQLRAALAQAYGPVDWVDLDALVADARDPEADRSEFRRYFLNSVVAAADRWTTPNLTDPLWTDDELEDGDIVGLVFDGSVGSSGGRAEPADSTALGAIRLSDGLFQPLGVWSHDRPQYEWSPPRTEVSRTVDEAHERFTVVRAYADPPHWQSELDVWAGRHGTWKGWPTFRPSAMTEAIERADSDMREGNVRLHDTPDLRDHLRNACVELRRQGQREYRRLLKPAPRNKIDLAVLLVLACEVRGDAIAAGEDVPPPTKARTGVMF